MQTRLLLIDDDADLAALLAKYLRGEGFEVETAGDGETGAARAIAGGFALVVLDVTMPGVDGIEALRRIRAASTVPVLMLTARGDDVDRIVGLELGADDYVPKPCTPRELAARIRAILRRTSGAVGAGTMSAGPLSLNPAQRRAQWQGKPLVLTAAEFNLLMVLAQSPGEIVSRARLSENGLGRPLARFDRSIDVHLSSIRAKLGRRDDGGPWIETVRGQGYFLVRECA